MIKKCFCKSDFQDAKYGPGMRVANKTKSGAYRCTVCGKEMVAEAKTKK